MKKIATLTLVAGLGLGLAACGETRNERTLSGALIGAGTGAVIGGAATGKAGGALVGGALGAGAGAVIGSQTRGSRRCYATNRYGERYRTRCRY
ncbi:glycine zipper domain-containing protein [Methylopila turkensis]|uniref:Glycine zipper domain-containing protein n=1 Tax=Methylopila turkensis TaxID=1437816 RepID=A0A9W6JS45_9HYPH|nr:cell envelope biogenesis protein OmpA [Methylopila turkensis]GLK80779.1 hypothetical protein GCM10008174_25200 [Methylopila turkensis]